MANAQAALRWLGAHRRDALLLPVYAGLSLISLRLKLAAAPGWISGALVEQHHALMAGTYANNEQSRLLQFLLPEALVRLTGASLPGAYAFMRWLFTFLAFVAFDRFMRAWLRPVAAFAGVALLAAILPFSHRAELQESAPLLSLWFVLALDAVRAQRRALFAGVMLLGALSNETILVLAMAWALVRAPKLLSVAMVRAIFESFVLAIPAFAVTAAIRWWTRHQPHLGGLWHGSDNLAGVLHGLSRSPFDWYRVPSLGPFFLFGALWIYPLAFARRLPRYFQRVLLVVPVFVAAHVLAGILGETRLMLPLAYVLVPASLIAIFGDDVLVPAADDAA